MKKKILLMTGSKSAEYLADMLWINFITDKNFHCVSNVYPSHFFSKENLDGLAGKGFTLYGKLSQKYIKSCPTLQQIRFLIKSNYFDYVVYPSVRRFDSCFKLCSTLMGKNRVIVVDGEDDKNISWHSIYSSYYKRELTEKAYSFGINPISYFLPEIIINDIKLSTKSINRKKLILAPCDPRNKKTYIYSNEDSYYRQYKESYFGYTMLKSGWDCLRHYEIIASGALPYFKNLRKIPKFTLKNYPRKLQKKTNSLYYNFRKNVPNFQPYINDYNLLQKEFENWLLESSKDFGSKELKSQLIAKHNISENSKINLFSLILINFNSNFEYLKEQNNVENINIKIIFKSIKQTLKFLIAIYLRYKIEYR